MAWNFSSSAMVATIHHPRVLDIDIPDGSETRSVIELSGESGFWFAGVRISHLVDRS